MKNETHRIVWHPAARTDLRQILGNIKGDKSAHVEQLGKAMDALAKNPYAPCYTTSSRMFHFLRRVPIGEHFTGYFSVFTGNRKIFMFCVKHDRLKYPESL